MAVFQEFCGTSSLYLQYLQEMDRKREKGKRHAAKVSGLGMWHNYIPGGCGEFVNPSLADPFLAWVQCWQSYTSKVWVFSRSVVLKTKKHCTQFCLLHKLWKLSINIILVTFNFDSQSLLFLPKSWQNCKVKKSLSCCLVRGNQKAEIKIIKYTNTYGDSEQWKPSRKNKHGGR